VVPVNDVVVPVSLTSLKRAALKSECTFPRAGLARLLVLGEGNLACIVVPGTEKVDGLDT